MNAECPVCQSPFEWESRKADAPPPAKGAHALCILCLNRLVYDEDQEGILFLRIMSEEEFASAPEYAQANMLQSEALARELRSNTPRISTLVDKINELQHAAAILDRGISESLYRLSQAHGILVQKHGRDEISEELGRIMEILERLGR